MSELLSLLFAATAVFAFALLAATMASKARAAVRHLILASAFAVALILPPLILLTQPRYEWELPTRAPEPVTEVPAIDVPLQGAAPLPAAAVPAITLAPPSRAAPIQTATWLGLAWVVVALLALAPMGRSALRLRDMRRSGRSWPEGAALLNELANGVRTKPPVLLLHDELAGPVTCGVLRPAIILPPSAVGWSGAHLANALVHELEHVRRHDWALHLLSRAVCAIYWFHPLAWIALRAQRLAAEQASDDAVLAREDSAAYAEQLLELARHLTGRPAPGLSMFGGSQLSRRIGSVLDQLRPRGRAGKLVMVGTGLVAAIALAALVTFRVTESRETRMYRATDMLAARSDANSLAAAALLNAHAHKESALRLMVQATFAAPGRADLLWLHVQLCETVRSCDPEPLERQLQSVDSTNGAAWFGALARAATRGDDAGRTAALADIARAGRVDIYWNTLIAELSPVVAGTGELSPHDALVAVIGSLAAVAIPGYKFTSQACSRERMASQDVLELCRGVADAFLNGDTVITAMIGTSIAKRAWPEISPKWLEADNARRTRDHLASLGGDLEKWVRAHAGEYLDLVREHRREQDVHEAVLVALGENPKPPTLDRN